MVSSSQPQMPAEGRDADLPTGGALGALNAKTARRQKMILLSGGGAVALLGAWFVLGGSPDGSLTNPDAPQRIETDGIVNRDLSQKEFVAIYGNRLDAQARQLKALEDGRTNPTSFKPSSMRSQPRTRQCAPMARGRSTRCRRKMRACALRPVVLRRLFP